MTDDTPHPPWEPDAASPDPVQPDTTPGQLQRLLLAFTSPGELFAATDRAPKWVLALIALVVLGVVAQLVAAPHIDWEATVREQMSSRAQQLDDEALDRAVSGYERFGSIAPYIAVVTTPLAMLLVAGLFLAGLKVAGSACDFKRVLAVTVHSYWPAYAVSTVLFVALVSRIDKVSGSALQSLVKSHVGAFLSQDAPRWQFALGSSLDLFNLWIIVLQIIAVATVGKVKRATAAAIVLGPWVVYVVGKTGLTALFS